MPRPKIDTEEKKTVMLTLRLTKEEEEKLKKIAVEHNTTVSEWLRFRGLNKFKIYKPKEKN